MSRTSTALVPASSLVNTLRLDLGDPVRLGKPLDPETAGLGPVAIGRADRGIAFRGDERGVRRTDREQGRVQEPRRAAALARHYRDQERQSIAEIARRLGRAEATVKAYLYDPS